MKMSEHWSRGRALCKYFAIPGVTCADGLYMSVQASEGHYCTPKVTVKEPPCPYTHWEVLAETDPLLEPYFAWEDDDGARFYRFVPSKVIEAVVEAHGGDATDWAKIEAEETERQKPRKVGPPRVFLRAEGEEAFHEFGKADWELGKADWQITLTEPMRGSFITKEGSAALHFNGVVMVDGMDIPQEDYDRIEATVLRTLGRLN